MEQPVEQNEKKLKNRTAFEKKIMWLTIISFFVILMTIGAGTILREDRVSSQLENRPLAQAFEPTVQGITSGEDMVKLEKYFTDQLLLRGTLVEMQARLSKDILRQPFRNDIYIAENGYMIERIKNEIPIIPEAFGKFVQEVDRPVFYALAPSKTVIAERDGILPKYVDSNSQEMFNALKDGFTGAGITPISLDMVSLSDFYMTDHHWNIDGAYKAYGEIVEAIGKTEPTLKKIDIDDQSRRSPENLYYGSLARKTTLSYASKGDPIDYYDPDQFKEIDVCYSNKCGRPVIEEKFITEKGDYADRYAVFLHGNRGMMSMKSDTKGPKLLVLKDSFANPVLPFLARSANLEVIDIRYVDNSFDVSEFAEEKNVDAIVFLHNANINGLMKMYQQKL